MNVNSNENLFYPFTINANKCGRSCRNIDDSFARVCVPNKFENLNLKVFNLMSVVSETCECKCRLNYWGSFKNDFMWNPRTCNCECNKACKTDEYSDVKNCSCEKRLIGKLVLQCEYEILNTIKTFDKK